MSTKTKDAQGKDEDTMDAYCWDCHQSANRKLDYTCRHCRRIFHYICDNASKPGRNLTWDSSCPVCTELFESESNLTADDLPQLNQAIVIATDKLLSYDLELAQTRLQDLWTDTENGLFTDPVDTEEYPNYNSIIINPISLKEMRERAVKGLYKSAEIFINDMEKILHACYVFNHNRNLIIGMAESLFRKAFFEACKFAYCHQCYTYDKGESTDGGDRFLQACTRPHGLVWALEDASSSVYKAGKIINYFAVKPEGAAKICQRITVRFFGSRKVNDFPLSECFAYSWNRPAKSAKPTVEDEDAENKMGNELLKHICSLKKEGKREKKNMLKYWGELEDGIYAENNLPLSEKMLHLVEVAHIKTSSFIYLPNAVWR